MLNVEGGGVISTISNHRFRTFKRIPMSGLTHRHSDLISLGMDLSNNVFKGISMILTQHQGGEPLVCLVLKLKGLGLKPTMYHLCDLRKVT